MIHQVMGNGSPSQLLLQVHHVLVALGVVRRLGLHKVIQTAQVVSLNIHKQGNWNHVNKQTALA